MFFLISGFVLTKSWNGKYLTFLARRFIRLWPTYAFCLIVGSLIAKKSPIWTEFIWFPFLGPNDPRSVDPPMWSLILEAWMMPLMPFIVWAGTANLTRAVLSILAVITVGLFVPPAWLLVIFICGAFLSRRNFRNRWLETPLAQWLGKISYSLYLSHVLVLALFVRHFGPWGGVAAIPIVFCIALSLRFCIEEPSLRLSRFLGNVLTSQGSVFRVRGDVLEIPYDRNG